MLLEQVLGRTASEKCEHEPDFNGVWKNQLCSEMELNVSGSEVSGRYKSAVSGKGKPMEGALLGHINGDLIAFTVNWPTAAVTAWVGQAVKEEGRDVIRTLWQMTTNTREAEEPKGLWHSIFAGADRFTR